MGKRTPELDCAQEYARAPLGDERLNRRVESVVRRIERRPSASFPNAMVTEGELEGFYRLVNNEQVSADALLAPHVEATLERVRQYEQVLIVHDTTELRYTGARADLGRLTRTGRGYLGHFALAVSADERHDPLGVVGLEPWRRVGESVSKRWAAGEITYAEFRATSEETRWGRMVETVEQVLVPAERSAIHVMDSECDEYGLFAGLVAAGFRFVLRAAFDNRRVVSELTGARLRDIVSAAPIIAKRRVKLSRRRRRPDSDRPRGKVRDERMASLAVRAAPVTLACPQRSKALSGLPTQVTVNVVMVSEFDVLAGVEPVEWLLVTNEPIGTREEILHVVDAYRGRWVIEEFFKALKSGCAIEKRQAETWEAMQNVLALLVPIAWSLLRLRSLSRNYPDKPAAYVLTTLQLEVLRRASEEPIPTNPTVSDVMLAIARLGGHLRSNGDPGWQVLGRGYHDLLMLAAGYRLAQQKCDRC